MKQSSEPDAITETVSSAVPAIGGSDLVYLVDYEQTVLLAHLSHGRRPEPASIEGAMAGKAFRVVVGGVRLADVLREVPRPTHPLCSGWSIENWRP